MDGEPYQESGRRTGGAIGLSRITKPETTLSGSMEERRHTMAAVLQYQYRFMRAYVRYHLHYTPDVLDRMNIRQLAEAFEDVQFIRKGGTGQ